MENILFIEGRYNSIYGAQKSMLTLIENLPDKYKPILLTTKEGELSKYARKKNIQIKIIDAHPLINRFGGVIPNETVKNKIKIIKEIINYNLELSNYLKNKEFDLIYNNNFRSLILSFLATKVNNISSVYYKRADNKANYLIRKLVLRHSKLIFCISEGVKRAYNKKELKKYKDKFQVLYTGYKFDSFSENSYFNNNKKINIGLVGSLTPRKGHKIAIQTLKKLLDNNYNVEFNFYGGIPEGYNSYKKELNNLISKYSLENDITFHGFADDMKKVYRDIDISILPSKSEGLPRVLIESLANGIPVVASDVGGAREIIIDDYLGRIIDGQSVIKYYNAFKKIIDNQEYKLNQARRRKFVIDKFSINNYVNGFVNNIDKF